VSGVASRPRTTKENPNFMINPRGSAPNDQSPRLGADAKRESLAASPLVSIDVAHAVRPASGFPGVV
jgi:hypothetical protein